MNVERIALVTGANKGIGLQIAKELAAKGFTVLIGARKLQLGVAAAASLEGNARAIHLDVTDQETITAAARYIRDTFGRLDVLVNNAGISHAGPLGRSLEEMALSGLLSIASHEDVQSVFETNVFGVIAVTQAMLPLLHESPAGRVVNMSSMNGSLTLNSDVSNAFRKFTGLYAISKTALNAATLAFAIELESTNIKVNAVCPGFTATGLNNYSGVGTVEEAAREPVRLALLGEDGPTGAFSNADGKIPW